MGKLLLEKFQRSLFINYRRCSLANILSIETSSDALSVALLFNSKEYSFHEVLPKQHTERLLEVIESLLESAKAKLGSLDAISASCGPGSFTGIRLACTMVQGLAFSNKLLGIQVSSLEVLSENIHSKFAAKEVVAIVNAQMQQLYVGIFSYLNEGVCTSRIELVKIKDFNYSQFGADTHFVGDGCEVIKEKLKSVSRNIHCKLPNAIDQLSVAVRKFKEGRAVDPQEILPIYLVDEEQWKVI